MKPEVLRVLLAKDKELKDMAASVSGGGISASVDVGTAAIMYLVQGDDLRSMKRAKARLQEIDEGRKRQRQE